MLSTLGPRVVTRTTGQGGSTPGSRLILRPQERQSCRLSRPRRAGQPKEDDGISLNVAYSGLWGQIVTFPKRRPFITNVVIATAKTSIADLIVQRGEGKKEIKDVDWSRNAVFAAFGFAYLGIVQWFVYVTVFVRLCPNAVRFTKLSWAEKLKDRAGQIDLIKQTAYDNFFHYTFMYFPTFYIFKEAIQAENAGASFSELVSSAMAKYKKNCIQDNLYLWAMWITGDILINAAPMWTRLPLNHGMGLVWTMILSSLRGAEK
jgi:hypothetical protein